MGEIRVLALRLQRLLFGQASYLFAVPPVLSGVRMQTREMNTREQTRRLNQLRTGYWLAAESRRCPTILNREDFA